ncbi:hypothetical protein RND81_09G057900 [Saponaria officinalis]|uniref:Uncharacterized protein n=1 Tax=Saponaria officinalis TaxID=3572 RepID=A0AAW1IJ61_SAPOF
MFLPLCFPTTNSTFPLPLTFSASSLHFPLPDTFCFSKTDSLSGPFSLEVLRPLTLTVCSFLFSLYTRLFFHSLFLPFSLNTHLLFHCPFLPFPLNSHFLFH